MANDSITSRLEEIRAERARLDAERAARELEREQAEQLEREERELANAKAIADAEIKHGPIGKKIAVVETDLGVIILQRSHPLMFRRFADGGSVDVEACDRLVRPCVIYPDIATYNRILDELPATLQRLANAVAVLAGVRMKEVQAKP